MEYFVSERRRDAFIRIHQKHPVFGRLRMGKRFLIAIAAPLSLENSVRIILTDFDGPIGAEGIHDNDLITPSQAFETIADAVFLVVTNNDCGNLRLGRHIQLV